MSRPAPLRIALVGCGAIAEYGHVPALLSLPEQAAVTSVVDSAAARRELVGELLHVPAARRHGDVAALVRAGDPVDLAVVILPPRATPAAVEALLAAGTPVLAEKPVTADPRQAARLAGSAAPGRLGIVHNYLHRSDVRQALEHLRSEETGPVRFLRLEQPDAGHFPGAGDRPHWRRNDTPEGCLLDNAYHWVYVAAELAGAPVVKVTARLSRPVDGSAVDVALLLLDHANGVLTSVQTSWCAKDARPVLEVHTDRGSLRLEGDCAPCTPTLPGAAASAVALEPAYLAFYRDVLAAVRAGVPFAAPPDSCVAVLRVLAAATESARTGRTVTVGAVPAVTTGGPDQPYRPARLTGPDHS
ncbi:Gfo/Idh/MocA family protein [Actinacidiphila sp. bgisy144]|uniref:Gfo/Idh/MocA family protein n=1 Tax=Actinacidiphila sp. bgisy144 TaxID=3413791 RepID=UPI003EBE7540